jgi:hypothetical protein
MYLSMNGAVRVVFAKEYSWSSVSYARTDELLRIASADFPEFLSSVRVPLSEGVPIPASVYLGLPNVSFDVPLPVWPQRDWCQIARTLYRLSKLLKAVLYADWSTLKYCFPVIQCLPS